MAPVEIDGEVLFSVRGIQALPAPERAASIASAIAAVAADRSVSPDMLRIEDRGAGTFIAAGRVVLIGMDDEDARIEGVQRSVLAKTYVDRIGRAIVEYREMRTRTSLAQGAARAAAAVAIAAAVLVLSMFLLRRAEARLQRGFDRRVGALATEPNRVQRVRRLRDTLRSAIGLLRATAVLVVTLFLVEYILVQFPWTRRAGLRLFNSIDTPLTNLVQGFVAAIPSLIVLAILFLITRYGLALARIYFDAVHDGSVRWGSFDPDWAEPTYNLVRMAAIAVALVIAYPFIPGSESDAFKGLSILGGALVAFGSGATMANLFAGYMLIYRGAFRVGDRVDIGEVKGIVTEMRLQATHIRTKTNEEVTIPNSMIVGREVTNYSKPAREGRLILHTEISIGYDTSWRQVEALLIDAANRTSSVLKDPKPFVVQLTLGEFAVTYQINAYSNRAEGLHLVYAELHRNILDRFNEAGVQIMTPAYEGDPEIPKIVAPAEDELRTKNNNAEPRD